MIKNQIEDFKPLEVKLTGIYRGVVESVDDPLQSGRVRIRIFGLHTDRTIKTTTEGVPETELLWAEPALPILEGAASGKGLWGVPAVDSHVFVFFENGNHMQPRYFASVPGQGDWPTTSYPYLTKLETSGGQIIEFDNTEGSETVRIYHPKGTYIKIDKDGNIMISSVGNEEKTVSGNETKTISGNSDITISGNATITVNGSLTVTAAGNMEVSSSGTLTVSGATLSLN